MTFYLSIKAKVDSPLTFEGPTHADAVAAIVANAVDEALRGAGIDPLRPVQVTATPEGGRAYSSFASDDFEADEPSTGGLGEL
jgi:hypothetical protein